MSVFGVRYEFNSLILSNISCLESGFLGFEIWCLGVALLFGFGLLFVF